LLAAALTLGSAFAAGCGDGTAPLPGVEGVNLQWVGGSGFTAAGSPTYAAGSVVPATFAVAIADSVGGIVIAAYQQLADRGDLFVLQLTENRLGTHGPCAVITSPSACHGRIIENVTATNTTNMAYFQVTTGTVQIQSVGDRLVGKVSGLRLEGPETRIIEDGTIDLPFIQGEDAIRMMRCFLATAQGNACP
jgi:hypothetical protein